MFWLHIHLLINNLKKHPVQYTGWILSAVFPTILSLYLFNINILQNELGQSWNLILLGLIWFPFPFVFLYFQEFIQLRRQKIYFIIHISGATRFHFRYQVWLESLLIIFLSVVAGFGVADLLFRLTNRLFQTGFQLKNLPLESSLALLCLPLLIVPILSMIAQNRLKWDSSVNQEISRRCRKLTTKIRCWILLNILFIVLRPFYLLYPASISSLAELKEIQTFMILMILLHSILLIQLHSQIDFKKMKIAAGKNFRLNSYFLHLLKKYSFLVLVGILISWMILIPYILRILI
jgi:hypothetical protein